MIFKNYYNRSVNVGCTLWQDHPNHCCEKQYDYNHCKRCNEGRKYDCMSMPCSRHYCDETCWDYIDHQKHSKRVNENILNMSLHAVFGHHKEFEPICQKCGYRTMNEVIYENDEPLKDENDDYILSRCFCIACCKDDVKNMLCHDCYDEQ